MTRHSTLAMRQRHAQLAIGQVGEALLETLRLSLLRLAGGQLAFDLIGASLRGLS